MIDLITIEHVDRKEMSLVIVGEDIEDKIRGPVPYKNAISVLAPMLVEELPNKFGLQDAIQYLMVLHFRNMTARRNSAGQPYPWVCK